MGETLCGISFILRAVTAADGIFVRDLYLNWLSERLELDRFPEALRDSLLAVQWRGHQLSLRTNRPDAESSVVEVNGIPVGWTLVDRSGNAIHLVEIHIAQSRRGHGLGRALIAALQSEAAEAGRALTLCVFADNLRAYKLYREMGFEEEPNAAGDSALFPDPFAVILPLRWTPSASSTVETAR